MSSQKNRITVTTETKQGNQSATQSEQPPLERIRETVQLILRVYGKPSGKKSNRIYFDKE